MKDRLGTFAIQGASETVSGVLFTEYLLCARFDWVPIIFLTGLLSVTAQ